jgi:hypothetical protein
MTDNVAFLTGDNCNVNKRIARDKGKHFVGCSSHRFNLACEKFLKCAAVDRYYTKVADLMVSLRTYKNSARLRRKTSLGPKRKNETRWTGAFDVIERYDRWCSDASFTLEELFVDIDEVLQKLPSPVENARLKPIIEAMKILRLVTQKLQEPTLTLLDARIAFDNAIAYFSEEGESTIKFDFEPYLGVNAQIVDREISKDFENGIVKLQTGLAQDLNTAETEAVTWFKNGDEVSPIYESVDATTAFLAEIHGIIQPT